MFILRKSNVRHKNSRLPTGIVHTLTPISLTLLIACGGGGGSDDSNPPSSNPPPTASGIAALYSDMSANLPDGLGGRCMDGEAADIDGDGDIDLILALEFAPNLLLRNDGNANFTALEVFNSLGRDSEDIAIADFDDDGDLDVLFVSEDDVQNEFYLNQGDANFLDASERITSGGLSNAVVARDLNDDNIADIIIGNNGQNAILINNGDATFIDISANTFIGDDTTQDIELADIDNDGDPDIVIANENLNQVFINNGGLIFSDGSNVRLPGISAESRDVDLADIDNDGDLDMLVANVTYFNSFDDNNYLLVNDGSGNFSLATLPTQSGDHVDADFVDLDRDGDLDIITTTASISDSLGTTSVYLNDGNGVFSGDTFSSRGNAFDIIAADFNGDNKQDLYFCNRRNAAAASGFDGGEDKLFLAN